MKNSGNGVKVCMGVGHFYKKLNSERVMLLVNFGTNYMQCSLQLLTLTLINQY